MSKIVTYIKKYWLIILLGAGLLITLFIVSLPKPTPPTTTVPKPTPIPTTPITSLAPVQTGLQSSKKIIWGISSLDIPISLPVIHTSPAISDISQYNNVAKFLNINTTSKQIPNSAIFVYSSTDNLSSYYVNFIDKIAKYHTDLDPSNQTTTTTKPDPETLLNQLVSTLSKINPLPEGLSYRVGNYQYLTISTERYLPADKTTATHLEITLDYEYQQLPIKYRGLSPVTAIYTVQGLLSSLSYLLPPSQIQPSEDYQLKNFEDLKNTKPDEFEIISVTGNKNYILSDQTEIIETTTIKGGQVGYLFNPTNSAITPYVFLTGTAQSKKYGTLDIILTTSLLLLK